MSAIPSTILDGYETAAGRADWASVLLSKLETKSGRPLTVDEIEMLVVFYDRTAATLAGKLVEQLRREAAAGFNAWLARQDPPFSPYVEVCSADIKERALHENTWLVYIDLPCYRTLPSLGESSSRVEALKLFIACVRGEL